MPGKLTYFPLGIRAEPIRAVLYFANQQYEDNRISQEEFGRIKSTLPLGSLPIWEEDGTTIAQSGAILRMVGIRHGFYTTDPSIAWEIDSLIDFMEENYNDSIGVPFKIMSQAQPTDEDKQKFTAYFDKMIPFLNTRLENHGKRWIAGTETPTIADFKVYQGLLMKLEIDICPIP